MVASDPQLAQPAAALNGKARAGGNAARCVHLSFDLADLDAERVLLQAASANAAVQLGAGPQTKPLQNLEPLSAVVPPPIASTHGDAVVEGVEVMR